MTACSLKVGLSLKIRLQSTKNLIVPKTACKKKKKEKKSYYILVWIPIIFTYHASHHTALMSMFVFVCLFCDIQSHGTSIAVWGETSITGFVLHASKAHCPEMSVPSLICVSTHMPLWQYRTAPAANGVDAQWLKTNPSHRKNGEGSKRGRGGREAGGGGKKTMAALYFIVLKGYSSQWSHCQAPCLYIHGGIKPMPNSFMGADLEKSPIMQSHRQTAVHRRHICSSSAKSWHNQCA